MAPLDPARATLADALERGAIDHPTTLLHFAGAGHETSIGLGAVVERARSLAASFRARGIAPGDRIAVQVPNWVEGVVTYVAAAFVGAVVVPIIHIYGPSEVGFIVRESRARMLVVPDRWRNIDYLERLGRLDAGPALEQVVIIGDDVPSGCEAWYDLEARGAGAPPCPAPATSPDDVAFLIYTSGTSGTPKGVLHSHATVLAEVESLGAMLGDDSRTTVLGSFPAGHIAGVAALLRSFVLGVTTVLLDSWDASLAAALVEHHGVHSSAGTPFFLTSLLDAGEAEGRDLSSLDRFMVGAANVPRSVVDRADAAGVRAYRAYGSTEHPTVTSGHPSDELDRRATTDGRLTPGNELRIVDDDGRDVPDGSPGEIVTRGPERFVGYSSGSSGESFLPGGWFRTGDIGVFEGGYLTVVDRKKDIIIRGGENIASKEVEDILLDHPAVADAAVVAAPDQRLGESVCAFVVLRGSASLTIDDVRRHFERAGVARQKTPERIEIVHDLPRGHGGKVQKVELRARLRGEDPGQNSGSSHHG